MVSLGRPCANMCSVTSQGSPYARFRRALETRNPTLALTRAAELPHVSLPDALALLLLLRDRDRSRYGRAAGRWVARYLEETTRSTSTSCSYSSQRSQRP